MIVCVFSWEEFDEWMNLDKQGPATLRWDGVIEGLEPVLLTDDFIGIFTLTLCLVE